MENLGFHLCILIVVACINFPIYCFDNHDHHHHDVQNKLTALFVFGDSMFDPGNNNYLSNPSAYRANFEPYGESFFKHPTGRFSDGRLIPDFIAEFANLPMIPSYYQALHNHSFNHGVNFASAGAGCLDETYSGKEIYKLGGRKFGIQNLLPLGCLPRFRGLVFLKESTHGDCLDSLNSIVKKHNLVLSQKLKQFKKELRGFKYSLFSIFDALDDLFENPSTYGFKEAKAACCGFGPYRGFGSCGKAEAYELCKNVKEHVIFDSFHPSEKAFHHFARIWWQGDPNVVEPQSLKYLLA